MTSPLDTQMLISALGDRAVLVTLGNRIDEAIHHAVRAAQSRLESANIPGVIELVPAYASIAVHYDPLLVVESVGASADDVDAHGHVVAQVAAALRRLEPVALPPSRTLEIPVVYGGAAGPDLTDLAERHGLSPDEVIRLHTGADYLVYMLGFAPGFAYLGGLPRALATPRRETPRARVPAGSVAIGGEQAGVYPIETPGGWHVIGRTTLAMFDASREPAALLAVGDRVRFRAVSADGHPS